MISICQHFKSLESMFYATQIKLWGKELYKEERSEVFWNLFEIQERRDQLIAVLN